MCVCVCVQVYFYVCMSPLLFPLCCTCHMPDYLPISFVLYVRVTHHTHTNTHTPPKSAYRFLFFLAPPSAPPSSFFFYISRQLTFFSLFLNSLRFCPGLLSCFPSVSPLSPPLPLSHWKKKKTSSHRLARNPDVYV